MYIFKNDKRANYEFKQNFFVRLVHYFNEYTKPKIEAITVYFIENNVNSFKDINKKEFEKFIRIEKYDKRLSNDILEIDEEIFRCFVAYTLSTSKSNVVPNKKMHFIWNFLHFLYENINLIDKLSPVILIESDKLKLMLKKFMKNHEENETFNKYNAWLKQTNQILTFLLQLL
jgi:hypothetical protein